MTWRGVTPRSAESRWRMSCDGNFSKANTCSSTTKTGREMFQRGALISRFPGSEGAAKEERAGQRRSGGESCISPTLPPLSQAVPGLPPCTRATPPLNHSPPSHRTPLPPQPGGEMNWATAVTSIGLRISGARAHGGQRAWCWAGDLGAGRAIFALLPCLATRKDRL